MINPMVFTIAISGFLLCLTLHIIVWRVLRPVKHLVWLGIIFLFLPGLVYGAWFLFYRIFNGQGFFASPFNFFYIFILHSALSSAYIMTYPAFQAVSPSLKIILEISGTMPFGMSREEIDKIFSEQSLIKDRLKDLSNEGLIRFVGDKWVIALKGKILACFFYNYRRLLKLPIGEG